MYFSHKNTPQMKSVLCNNLEYIFTFPQLSIKLNLYV